MMQIKQADDIQWGVFPEWKNDPGLVHAFSTRNGGVSNDNLRSLNLGRTKTDSDENVLENRRRFFSSLELDLSNVVHAKQVHSAHVALVREPGVVDNCDGLITDQPNLTLIIGVADCHTIFLASKDRKVVGVLHAGWRGIVGNTLENAIALVQDEFDYHASEMEIGISPGIGVECYEVGSEVAEQFHPDALEQQNGRWHANLAAAIELRTKKLGIPSSQIFTAARCTSCESQLWYSYRRDNGDTGRMWGIITRTQE